MATYVLVHGSYQGGWIWQPIANRLRAAGHQVYAPSLDGCGERKGRMRAGITTETQADEVSQLLFYEDLKDVVLVGTSYGGMVACRAAELMRERIGRLVFVDALTLFDGEKVADILPRTTSVADGVTLRPSPEDAATRLFADLDPKIRAWALERYTPHPIAFRFQPIKLDMFWSQQWKASVIWCRQAQNPGEAHQRRAADRLGAQWAELDTGHYPMLSAPTELAALLTAG
jgi:pimeloyl-ACP methyl ester carboxylesterase